MAPVTLFGIANCDTIKKAKSWLEGRGIAYRFHDYRKQGLDAALLQSLESALGWEAMLNRRGTTWRALPDAVKQNIDRESALAAMLDNPALIKRPILARDNRYELGFSEELYEEVFD
jgi:Spx/MgsR family transcriptional regulator